MFPHPLPVRVNFSIPVNQVVVNSPKDFSQPIGIRLIGIKVFFRNYICDSFILILSNKKR